MKVEEILEEMENIMLESGRVPFTNKRLVEEDDMTRLIDELRDAMPSQLVEAGRIVSDRQRILEEAQQKSDEIIQQAKAYHSKLTDENLITRQAQEQANEIVTSARKEAEQTIQEAERKAAEIMEIAQKSAQELALDAMVYADQVFNLVETNLSQSLDTVKKGHDELKQQFRK